MDNPYIIHKIALYINDALIVKILMKNEKYIECIIESDLMYNELYMRYGKKDWTNTENLRGIKCMYELMKKNADKNIKIDNDMLESCISKILKIAIKKSNVETIEWLSKQITNKKLKNVMDDAVCHENLELVKILHERGFNCTEKVIDLAAYKNNFEIIKWLHDNISNIGCTQKAMDIAASKGNIEIIRYLHKEYELEITEKTINYAIVNNHFELSEYLYEKNKNYKVSQIVLYEICKLGYIEILQWIYKTIEIGDDIDDKQNLYTAAVNGHLEIVQYLHETRSPKNKDYHIAIVNELYSLGYYKIIMYLHKNGYVQNENAPNQ